MHAVHGVYREENERQYHARLFNLTIAEIRECSVHVASIRILMATCRRKKSLKVRHCHLLHHGVQKLKINWYPKCRAANEHILFCLSSKYLPTFAIILLFIWVQFKNIVEKLARNLVIHNRVFYYLCKQWYV
jgi:hypothetical protein